MRLGLWPGSPRILDPERADLANGFANDGPGRPWMRLEAITFHVRQEQGRPTIEDDPGHL
jgi:hypothetical protein